MRKPFLLSPLSQIDSASADIVGNILFCYLWMLENLVHDGCLAFEVREKLDVSAVEQSKDKCQEAELC